MTLIKFIMGIIDGLKKDASNSETEGKIYLIQKHFYKLFSE